MWESERQSADTCHIYTVLLPASPAGTRRPTKKTKQRSTLTTSDQPSQPRKESKKKEKEKEVGGDKQKEQKVRKPRGQGNKKEEGKRADRESILVSGNVCASAFCVQIRSVTSD